MEKVLLVDHSGRGHAYAELLSRTSPRVTVLYAPGCAAITTDRVISVPELSLVDPRPMVEYALQQRVDAVLVGNAMALARGFVDAFRDAGLFVIGPDKAATRLEASKSYTKRLCTKYGIRVADHASFDDADAARAHVRTVPYQVVVKADGLCGGNGAIVCDTVEEAEQAIHRLMVERVFGDAGATVVIEQRLYGRELSFFALTDGEHCLRLPMAVDYPKSDDGNRGVTSGGMGAFTPHPDDVPALTARVETELLAPVMRCIREEGLAYTGVLYLGCFLTDDALYLLEINARMGDPEAEVVFPRIENDFWELCGAIQTRTLDRHALRQDALHYCNVVATQGPTRRESGEGSYPGWPFGEFGRSYPITGLAELDLSQCKLFLGEASVVPGKGLVSNGGRVLHVVGVGETRHQAVEHAYANIRHVRFEGIRYRTDIGKVVSWDERRAPEPPHVP